MFDALHHSHSRLLLLLAVPQVEGHRAVALTDLTEELSAGFHLEHVGQPSLLKYCRLGVLLLVLPVSGAEQHIDSVDLVLLELVDLPVLGLQGTINIQSERKTNSIFLKKAFGGGNFVDLPGPPSSC